MNKGVLHQNQLRIGFTNKQNVMQCNAICRQSCPALEWLPVCPQQHSLFLGAHMVHTAISMYNKIFEAKQPVKSWEFSMVWINCVFEL